MNNKKTTKRALLSSILSLLLCCSMLIGTTFAWFTDEVKSANNIITAGNLDVELEYYNVDAKKWEKVTSTTNVFEKNTLWEPGHTEVVYLKISNLGTLAFDYKLGVNIVSEVKSINVEGDELKLSNYIMMGVVESTDENFYETRQDARKALDANKVVAINKGYSKTSTLYSTSDPASKTPTEEYVALVVYMPETIGNEANYKTGAEMPTIQLGINLLATQETYENDSFNNQYDANAGATVEVLPTKQFITATVYDVFGANQSTTDINMELDIYEFIANNFQEAYPVDEYENWTCDFFVSTDSAVNKGLILVGNYADYGWLGFWVPQNDQAYEPVGLLGYVTSGGESNWTYKDICEVVQIFRCGLIDYQELNSGVKVTVELRMTSPDKTQTITVSRITVTL